MMLIIELRNPNNIEIDVNIMELLQNGVYRKEAHGI